jgi:hypothetical protein
MIGVFVACFEELCPILSIEMGIPKCLISLLQKMAFHIRLSQRSINYTQKILQH